MNTFLILHKDIITYIATALFIAMAIVIMKTKRDDDNKYKWR